MKASDNVQQPWVSGPARHWRQGAAYVLIIAFVATWFGAPAECPAQGDSRAVPGQTYYLGFGEYHAGEFERALRIFREAGRSGVKSSEGLWIDSVCYFTMQGECLYQLGENAAALDSFNMALKQAMAHQGWMLRIDFPQAIEPETRALPAVTWGASKRRIVVGRIPGKMGSFQGRINNEAAFRMGGVVAPPQIHSLDVQEISRCIAVALRRRMQIMGPTCRHDPFTAQLVQSLSRRSVPPNHWSQAWIDCQLGIAYASEGEFQQAISQLQKSLVVAGQYDHELTPLALLVIGELALEQENFAMATDSFAEATYSAALQSQYDVMAEAFNGAMQAHIVSGRPGVFPPLEAATAWSRRGSRRGSRFLTASLLLMAAENYAALGQAGPAAELLSQARREFGRGDIAGRASARWNYQSAYVNFQTGNLAAGTAALYDALRFQKGASLRLFQMSLADNLHKAGATDRVAALLYADVLREPTSRDWALAPMETLSVVTTPHEGFLENWFYVALKRREVDTAAQIADQIRRHRFHSTLPLGGRLLSLRWILAAPENMLSPAALLQRQDLIVRRPRFAELARRAENIRAELGGMAFVAVDDEAARKQADLYSQLAKVSAGQEVMLREIALSRQPSEFMFPPQLDIKALQAALPPRRLVLAYLVTRRNVHGFAFGNSDYAHWVVDSPVDVRKNVVNLLKQMGNVDQNHEIEIETLQESGWKDPARQAFQLLAGNMKPEDWDKYDEVVIVPDGLLWYAPFESMLIGEEGDLAPLISRVRLRYVPTVSLAAPEIRRQRALNTNTVVAGALFPRDPAEVAEAAVADLESVLPGVARVPERPPADGNLLASLSDRLVVLHDIDAGGRNPYDWAPMPYSRGKSSASLESWLALPWEGPQQIALPGYHTSAENALKGAGNGREVFLSVCGLMGSGARTVLLSRWRTGGQTSFALVREFVQELPYTSASEAWQRSVHLAMTRDLDPVSEPRIKESREAAMLKADHPFFWSGYLLVDTGYSPGAKNQPVVQPAAGALEDEPDTKTPAAAGEPEAGPTSF